MHTEAPNILKTFVLYKMALLVAKCIQEEDILLTTTIGTITDSECFLDKLMDRGWMQTCGCAANGASLQLLHLLDG